MLGPSIVSGWPQQNMKQSTSPAGGNRMGKTSAAQQDSGLFETNLRAERYLPFEGAGVISEWQLELPANPSEDDPTQFDYDTITDVVLHIRYTARDGGAQLGAAALEEVKRLIGMGSTAGSVRLFSARHEFPTQWAKFTSQTVAANQRHELGDAGKPVGTAEETLFLLPSELRDGRFNHPVRATLQLFANTVAQERHADSGSREIDGVGRPLKTLRARIHRRNHQHRQE